MRALILCAGRGERLRPVTDTLPKPLIDVAGQSLLGRHLTQLARAGVDDVLINVSWLATSIIEAVGGGSRFGLRVAYSVEGPAPLETLGGIRQALPWLGEAPFWLVNGDVFIDLDFAGEPLTLEGGDAARLVLVPNPPHNPGGDFDAQDGRVTRPASGPRRYTYAGVGLFAPDLFAGVAAGRAPLAPLLFTAAAERRLAGVVHGGRWDDVGTAERLAALRQWLATRPGG